MRRPWKEVALIDTVHISLQVLRFLLQCTSCTPLPSPRPSVPRSVNYVIISGSDKIFGLIDCNQRVGGGENTTIGRERKASSAVIPAIHVTIFSDHSTGFARVYAVTSSAICCFIFER